MLSHTTSNQFRQFLTLFVKQCSTAQANLWTTFPDYLNGEVKNNVNFLELCGFKVTYDYPHAGNGYSVSPLGEISINWNDGKMNRNLLTHLKSESDDSEHPLYVVNSPPSESNTYVGISSLMLKM